MSPIKTGLQKDVSEIFNGVSPQKDADDFTPPKEDAPAPEVQDNAATKQSVPSHMTPNKPKSDQPASKKESSNKKPKAQSSPKFLDKILKNKTVQKIKNKLLAPKEGVSNKRQKVTIALVPVLFIGLIFMYIRAFSSPSGNSAAAPVPSGSKGAAAADSEEKLNWKIPEPYPETLRDPMQFGSTTSHSGGLVVKGILYSQDNPSAVIGNYIVHEGDKIMDVVIVKITEDSVEFQANDKKWIQKVQR